MYVSQDCACEALLHSSAMGSCKNFSTYHYLRFAHVHACLRVIFCCAECQVAIVGKSVIAVWMIVCFFAGVAYCAYRRTQLREKFGIAGAPRHLHVTACIFWVYTLLTLLVCSCADGTGKMSMA